MGLDSHQIFTPDRTTVLYEFPYNYVNIFLIRSIGDWETVLNLASCTEICHSRRIDIRGSNVIRLVYPAW